MFVKFTFQSVIHSLPYIFVVCGNSQFLLRISHHVLEWWIALFYILFVVNLYGLIQLFSFSFFFISPGIMLLIYSKTSSHVPLKILSIEDGTVLKSFNHLIHRNSKVDFIEQFNEKLLVKQENENLQILDVSNAPKSQLIMGYIHCSTSMYLTFNYL